jgi:hypothetical protein
VTEQLEKPNLEVLLSEFVAELKRPLDPQVLSLFSRRRDPNLSSISAFSSTSTLTSGAHNNCSFANYALVCFRMGVGIGILPELEEILVMRRKEFRPDPVQFCSVLNEP